MYYHGIQSLSLANGEGCRVVLWVAGCEHKCKGCHNSFTWDPYSGQPFDDCAMRELMQKVSKTHIDGLTLSGGDPMYLTNRQQIADIAKAVKCSIGKSIWMYTGYEFSEIKDEPVLNYIDAIVDGKFVEELKGGCKWAGSSNQKLWRKVDGVWKVSENGGNNN